VFDSKFLLPTVRLLRTNYLTLQEGLEKQNISKEELKKDILGTDNDKFT